MTGLIEELLRRIKQKKRSIGDIIDDRSLNRIQFHYYTEEYKKLEELEKTVGAFAE